jgi:hypothetical protein
MASRKKRAVDDLAEGEETFQKQELKWNLIIHMLKEDMKFPSEYM